MAMGKVNRNTAMLIQVVIIINNNASGPPPNPVSCDAKSISLHVAATEVLGASL
jgi:hypothetical protein